jgi:plastocyanin
MAMQRRHVLGSLGVGSLGVLAAALVGPVRAQHAHSQVDGPLANATVSFGQWKTDPPLDRMIASPPPANSHLLIPYTATIKAGGTVNFVIAGLHQVLVYGPGTTLGSINAGLLVPSGPGFPPLVNDPVNRVYRGLNPAALFPLLDRVEVVKFDSPGTHLVVCGVLPHFSDAMHGWVKVL